MSYCLYDSIFETKLTFPTIALYHLYNLFLHTTFKMINKQQFFQAIETGDYDIVHKYDMENISILKEWILEPETGIKRTALYWAVKHNQPDIVELLCELGHLVIQSSFYDTEDQSQFDDYPYPILLAQDQGYTEIIEILLHYGGDWRSQIDVSQSTWAMSIC